MSELADDVTEDAFLGGKLRLRQPKSGHRAGHDAMLLAAATPARSGDRVVDLGAGVGAAGLAVARRVAGIKLVSVEINKGLAELARANASANAIAAEALVLDVTSGAENFAFAGLLPDSVDVVLMNPPFNDPSRHRASPDKSRERAHVATANTLDEWIHASQAYSQAGRQSCDDLARGRNCGRAGGARSRFRQPDDPAGPRRCGVACDPAAGARHQRRAGADPAARGSCAKPQDRRSLARCPGYSGWRKSIAAGNTLI